MDFSFINVKNVIKKHNDILKSNNDNKWIFWYIPIIIGIILSVLFIKDSSSILDILTLFLSIFIPIFLSLLATLISFVMNKIKTRQNKDRIPLIKETFYNICYLIPVSISLLLLSLFMEITWLKGFIVTNLNFDILEHHFSFDISVNTIFIFIVGILFYSGIAHLIMNILMITKRIFILFDKEIDIITNPELTEDDDNSTYSIAMLIGIGNKEQAKEKVIDYILSDKKIIKAFNLDKEALHKSFKVYSDIMEEVGITESDIDRAFECNKKF